MNIYNNSVYEKVNVLNYSNPLKYRNINSLHNDTVSFGASVNIGKRIEEYKTYNSSGNHSIKRAEAEKIYEYFGFEKKSENTHIKYEGPYGQTIIIKRQNPIDPGAANDLISAIKRADMFNGELIVFDTEPSSEEIEKWKKIVTKRKPKKGSVNQYSLGLRTQRTSQEDTKPNEIAKTGKQDERKLNDLKKQISLFLVKVSNAENNLANLHAEFSKLKSECLQNGLSIPKSEFTDVEEQIESEKGRTKSIKETVESYKEKLSLGKNLSDDEKAQLAEYLKEDFSFENIKSAIGVIEENCINALTNRDDLYSKLSSLINSASETIINYEIQLDEIKHCLSEASICMCLNAKDSKMLEQMTSKVERKFNEAKKQIEKYSDANLEEKSNQQLKTMNDNLLSMMGGQIVHIGEDLEKIQEIVNQKIIPYITYSPEDIEKQRQKRLDDFYKKVGHADSKGQKTVETQPKEESGAVATIEEETKVGNDESLPSITPQEPQTIQKAEITPQMSARERKILPFKEKLVEKTSPLPIKIVQTEMATLIDGLFDVDSLVAIQKEKDGVQNFVNALVSKISQTPEYKKLKNASRFALLETISKSSSKLPAQIYSLPISQLKNVYAQMEAGSKELEFYTATAFPMNFQLEKDVDMKQMEQKLGEYNVLLRDIDSKESGLVLDKLLSFVPNFPKKEMQNLILSLSMEGSYLKLLTDETTVPELKSSVLETFWKNYDNTYSTNYTVQVLEKFEEEQQRKVAAETQRKKLESVDKIDWSL
ncbi:hypothetical protein IJD15_05860 [bacterium]|nr:hypothetical protein [bacterium]